MKKLLLLLPLFLSCAKAIDSSQLPDELSPRITSAATATATVYPQIGRISFWMLYSQSNYLSARADYMELLISDTYSNYITADDKIKEDSSIGHDNLAIKNPYTSKLLWKELRKYPAATDSIRTKFWNLSEIKYTFKIICDNFPPTVTVYLYDVVLKKLTQLRLDRSIQYMTIDASTAALQNTHRFILVIKKAP